MNNHHVSLGGCLTINPKKTRKVPQTTSKSRLAVDREFMYIGSAGPGPGGRAEGRADGRAGGRGDFERQYNDFHRFSQKTYENLGFLVHFASDFHKKHIKSLCFIAKMKKWLRKHAKTLMFFDFSNQAGARVPMKNSQFAQPARRSTRKWDFRRRSRPRELAQRSQDDVSLNKLPQIMIFLSDVRT